jgi:pyruvyltransferase
LEYTGKFRRRARKLKNAARLVSNSELWPTCTSVKSYWWDYSPNFGDLLTLELLPHYGLAPTLHHGPGIEFCGVGSLLEQLPAEFDGTVWGTGKITEDSSTPLPHANFLAVRGEFTRNALELDPDTPLGDPGLLVSRWIPRRRRRFAAGIVPHYTQLGNPWVKELAARLGGDCAVIDVRESPARTIQHITECDIILSSSLHGVVIADSYGIPVLWDIPSDSLKGGNFKFRDYESAATPGRTRRTTFHALDSLRSARTAASPADRAVIGRLNDALEHQLDVFRRDLGRTSRPYQVFFDQFGASRPA